MICQNTSGLATILPAGPEGKTKVMAYFVLFCKQFHEGSGKNDFYRENMEDGKTKKKTSLHVKMLRRHGRWRACSEAILRGYS
jgi:hypothetical protein